jgi:hypothetical protein
MILFLRLIHAAACAAVGVGIGWFMFTIAMAYPADDPKVRLSTAVLGAAGFAIGWFKTREEA